MKCGNCGSELKEGAKFCPNCGNALEKPNVLEDKLDSSNEQEIKKEIINEDNEKKKKHPILTSLGVFWIACFVVVSIYVAFSNKNVVELGEPVEVEDVISITIDEGYVYNDGVVRPLNDINNTAVSVQFKEGKAFGLYGIVESLSSKKFDLNKVVEAKLIVDDKYEFPAEIWLENEERTEFQGMDSGDEYYLTADAYIYPKDKFPFVLMGEIGTSVYDSLSDESEIVMQLKILEDINDYESEITYKIPLSFS